MNDWELARKYAIRPLLENCEEALRRLFPEDLNKYTSTRGQRARTCRHRDDHLRCIALAKAHGLHTLLPPLYYSFYDGFVFWSLDDQDDWPADRSIAITLYSGRHNLLKLKRDVLDSHIRSFVADTSGVAFHCGGKLAKVFLNRFLEPATTGDVKLDYLDDLDLLVPSGVHVAADYTAGVEDVCDNCRQAWRESERRNMHAFWEALPGCFDLDPWETLREMEEQAQSQAVVEL